MGSAKPLNPYESPRDLEPPAEARTGSLLVIFLTVFVDLLGFGMVLPLLPVYAKRLAHNYQMSDLTTGLTIGLLLSSFSIMQFLCVPIWGRLSDRYGRRPILIIGLIGSTIFYSLFGVATAYASIVGLFLSRIGAGVAGATIATAQAYIADTTTKEKRNKGMALIGAAFALGFTLGPALGGVSLLAGGDLELSPWPGYVAGAFSGVALLMAIFWLPESRRPGTAAARHQLFDGAALRAAMNTPSVGLLLVTSFVAVMAFANFESTLSLQVRHMAEFQPEAVQSVVAWANSMGYHKPVQQQLIVILVVFVFLGLVLTLAQGMLVRRLSGKVSESRLALAGSVLAIIGFALLGVAATRSNFSLLLVAMAIEVTGFAFVNPSLQSLISRRSDPNMQGGILGLAQSFSSLARIVGPIFGNLLFPFGVALPYMASAVLMVVAIVMTALAARSGHDYPAGK